MGQAFDRDGNVLGEAFGATKEEVLKTLQDRHPDAEEIRIRAVKDQATQRGDTPTTLSGGRLLACSERAVSYNKGCGSAGHPWTYNCQCEEVGVDPYRCTLPKGHQGPHETKWPAPASVGGVAPRDASADLVAGLRQELQEARQIVADINNEVIGSHGWFTEPSCVEAVQKLKELANQRWLEQQGLLAGLEALQKEWREMMDRANEQAAVFAPDSPAFLLYRYEAATLKERIDGLARVLATRQEG